MGKAKGHLRREEHRRIEEGCSTGRCSGASE